MDFSAGAAVGAGLVATGVMTAMIYMGLGMFPKQMPMNLLYMLGTMMTRQRPAIYLMGGMMHAGMGVAFALVHTGLFQALGLESNLAAWGILFGFAHYLAFGMMMGMMPAMHPLMRTGQLASPGLYGKNYPSMNVMGILVVHLVYGLLVGILYEAWA